MANTPSPTFTQQIDQSVFIEPLRGPITPLDSLERFPDDLYNKSVDSHFIKFMYSLLGPAGLGWIKKEYLDAKLVLYAQGLSSFNIEQYYGDPFSFGRILEEELEEEPNGLLTKEEWEVIKTKDESYRSRAITFLHAARLGTTPEGMGLASQSGLNHSAFVIENYKSLFDFHTDFPLGLPSYGKTQSTEEFIIVPNQEFSRSSQQIISFEGSVAASGTFQLEFNGQHTVSLALSANNLEVETALEEIPNIGKEGVLVSGGPCPNPFLVTFTGSLSDKPLASLVALSNLADNLGNPVNIFIKSLVGGVSTTEETVNLPDEYKHNAQTAIDFLRPVNTLPTLASGKSTRIRQEFQTITSSSSYIEAIKFVTGSNSVIWPEPNQFNWIEPGKENQAKTIEGDFQANYVAFHNVAEVHGYTEEALEDPGYETLSSVWLEKYKSEHVGQYGPETTLNFPFLGKITDDSFIFSSERALPFCPIPAEINGLDQENNLYIRGTNLPAANKSINLEVQNWWSSLERSAPDTEYLEIDLGETKVVNCVSFEITRKPCVISLDFDELDSVTKISESEETIKRNWQPITLWSTIESSGTMFYKGVEYPAGITESPVLPPWQEIKIFFHNSIEENISTRFLRLGFHRTESKGLFGNLLKNPVSEGLNIPYSIDVRNLRAMRFAGRTARSEESGETILSPLFFLTQPKTPIIKL